MNSNRSLRSNTNIAGRTSPNLPASRIDSLTNRSSSPLNNRLSSVREQDNETKETPPKNFTENDRNFHRVAFDRCVNPTERPIITNREKFGQGILNYF